MLPMNEKTTDFFRSAYPTLATTEWVPKNFRGEKKIILLDLAPAPTDVSVVLQLYFFVDPL